MRGVVDRSPAPEVLSDIDAAAAPAALAPDLWDVIEGLVIAADRGGQITRCSAAATRLFGVDVGGHVRDLVSAVNPGDKAELARLVSDALENKVASERLTCHVTARGGDSHVVELRADPIAPGIVIQGIEVDARLDEILRHSIDLIAAVKEDGELVYVSSAVTRLLGHAPDAVIGDNAFDHVHPADHHIAAEEFARTLGGEARTAPTRMRLLRADGGVRWVDIRGDQMAALPGGAGLILNIRDATQQVLAEQAQRESEAQFKTAFENAPIGLVLLTPEVRIREVNEAFCTLMATPAGSLEGRSLSELLHPGDRHGMELHGRRLLAGTTVQLERRFQSGDNRVVWGDLRVTAVLDENGHVALLICQVLDVTERHELKERLAQQARHDPLTGLPTRVRAIEAVRDALEADGKVGVLRVDVDRFQDVNEALGHAPADRILVEVGARLSAAVDRPEDLVIRWGGDEFAVITTTGSSLVKLAEAIMAAFSAPFEVAGREIHLSVTIGAANAEEPGQPPETLLTNAEIALGDAKQQGQGRICSFNLPSTAAPSASRPSKGSLVPSKWASSSFTTSLWST